VGGAAIFVLLATANGASYRFGSSDQAFYIPAVIKAFNPQTFPRDTPLIDAQAGLIFFDEIAAATMRVTGMSMETLFHGGYVLSMVLAWIGLVLIGSHVYGSQRLTLALAAAFTMRHRIPRTSANSFEPYFHPRMVAFSIGLLAVAALLRRRSWLAIALVAVAAIVHATTAIWFAILLGVAIAILDRTLRPLIVAGAVVAVALLAWAAAAGPLRQSWVTMDSVWLQAVASKDSLFADQWPAWAWGANLGFLALLWWAHRARMTRGAARPEDSALVWGATALVALFLLTMPAVIARNAFVVEFQISRVFWLVDVLALVYVLAAISSARPEAGRVVAVLVLAMSVGRGLYVVTLEHPERALFTVRIPDTPWLDAMHWISRQPVGVQVLADPGHAWKYGTSVRVSAARDVFLEDVKDSALAIYSRDVAARVVERASVLGDFSQHTPDRAQALARQYEIDLLVTTADLNLPLAYQNAQFRIYSLR
jgi:hypothetical protein